MKCPKCNEEVDHRGILYHLKEIEGLSTEEMIAILFEEIETLKKQTMWNFKTITGVGQIEKKKEREE